MTKSTMDEISEICEKMAVKSAIELINQMQLEHDILTGKIPIPDLPPIRVPFRYILSKKSRRTQGSPEGTLGGNSTAKGGIPETS